MNFKAAEMLLKHGARTDTKDEFGMTPLKEAEKMNYFEFEEAFKKKYSLDWIDALLKSN